jgi:hypothetical protein
MTIADVNESVLAGGCIVEEREVGKHAIAGSPYHLEGLHLSRLRNDGGGEEQQIEPHGGPNSAYT